MKKRLGIISLFILLFIAFIVIWNQSYQSGFEEAYIPLTGSKEKPVIPSEAGVFKRLDFAANYAKMPVDTDYQRSLTEYYANRAYPGAPPAIPHPVADDGTVGGKSCLKCHDNGGFVPKFKAYAPVTPHPEMINCRQCHVSVKTNTQFVTNTFQVYVPKKVGNNKALLTSPPMIPHELQMRENCLACHAGPAAPKEIRVSHPERVNCRQCHLPVDENALNNRVFKRKSYE